jgi:hypothetical protein
MLTNAAPNLMQHKDQEFCQEMHVESRVVVKINHFECRRQKAGLNGARTVVRHK